MDSYETLIFVCPDGCRLVLDDIGDVLAAFGQNRSGEILCELTTRREDGSDGGTVTVWRKRVA